MRKLPPLGALRVFESAARRLSFKLAADELSVTPTAVSHQVRLLEEILGTRLFERRARQVRLTASGHALYPALRDGLDGFERAIDAVRHARASKVATLSSTVAFMAKLLAPRTGSFRTAHPDWTLRLDASNEPVDLETGADAAVRWGRGRYPGLLVDPLFQDRFAPVCVPGLAPAAKKDLRRATLVHFDCGAARDDERAPVWRTWLERSGVKGVAADAGISFTDEIHAVQATIAGQGVGLLSLTMVAEELASGVLVQPFSVLLDSYRYDLVYSPCAIDRPATTLLRNWIKSEFGNQESSG